MKKHICSDRHCFSFLLVFVSIFASEAQINSTSEIEMAKRNLQRERENIFVQALHLSISQTTVFHPIYVDFNKEKSALDDELISMIVKYGESYQHLNGNLMNDFIRKSEKYQRKELAVRKKFYKKLSKAISTELASQFYEVDDFVSTSLRMNILSGLPFTQSITKLLAKWQNVKNK